MNKTQLSKVIGKQAGISLKDANNVIDVFTEAVKKELKAGGVVNLLGFGVFKNKVRSARVGRNPQTGESINIPAKTSPAFKPSKTW